MRSIKRKGGKAVAIQANVSKSADVKRLFAETKAKLGAPSILVNNAGVFTFQPLEAVTEEEFHRQFDTNVLGTLLATREAVGAFNGEGGSVINISTISSINPVPSSVVYSASKSAVDAITKALAKELAGSQNPSQRHRAGHDGDRRRSRTSASRSRSRTRSARPFRWGGLVSRTTSRAWRFSWPRTSHPG